MRWASPARRRAASPSWTKVASSRWHRPTSSSPTLSPNGLATSCPRSSLTERKRMNRRRWCTIALLLVVALMGAACGSDDSNDNAGDTTTTAAEKAATFPADSTMAKIQQKGKLVVGTKFDQPGFGLKNPTT